MIECVPIVKEEVLSVALPPLNATGAPRFATPSLNCTVPVGLLPVTVAVKVTDCPTVDGLSEDSATVVVGPGPGPPAVVKATSIVEANEELDKVL